MPTNNPEDVDVANLYRKKGAKLRKDADDTKQLAKNTIKAKILNLDEKFPILPPEQRDYLLSLKASVDLPVTLFPNKYFEKPRFQGKKEFFQRLATDMLLYGLTQQRINGVPFETKEKFAEEFLKVRSWWQCELEDVIHALGILIDQKLSFYEDRKVFFEPLSMSADIVSVLNYAAKNWTDADAVALSTLEEGLHWTPTRVITVLRQMDKQHLVILENDVVYFPSLKK